MSKIGFKTDKEIAESPIEQATFAQIDPDIFLRRKGLEKSIEFLMDYLDNSSYPLLIGNQRDEWFVEKVRKVKERYFDEI